MTSQIHPQLSHCGVYARDIDRMVAFYTETIGLVVSDRGISSRGSELAFMTAAPGHHHQFVVVSGRAPEGVSTVNQLSFKVTGLDQLKEVHRRVRDSGVTEIRKTSHGGVPIDLSLPNDEIIAQTEKHCRATPGFMPLKDWQAEVERRLQAD